VAHLLLLNTLWLLVVVEEEAEISVEAEAREVCCRRQAFLLQLVLL